MEICQKVQRQLHPNCIIICHVPSKLKGFLIEQLKYDQQILKKPKEVLFVERSNVGKQSLINAILGQKVAQTSSKTGSTLRLQFHHIQTINVNVVNISGFGYSQINFNAQKYRQRMIYTYTKLSSRYQGTMCLFKLNHGIKYTDKVMLNKLQQQNVNIQILLTKCDKIKERMLYDRQLNLAREIKQFNNIHTIIHNVIIKDNFGINDLQYPLIDSFLINQSRQLVNIEDRLIKLIQNRNRLHKNQIYINQLSNSKKFAIANKLEQSSSYQNAQKLTFLNMCFILMNKTLTQFIFINIHVCKLILIKK